MPIRRTFLASRRRAWYTGWDYAYQPRLAASLAASYVNLVSPGTGNLPGTGTPLAWNAIDGWIGDGATTYLQTGLTPTSAWSMLVWYSNDPTAHSHYLGGCQKTGNTRLFIAPYVNTNNIQFAQGAALSVAGYNVSGCLAVSGQQGYKNGVAIGGAITAGTNPAIEFYIGALNNNGAVLLPYGGSIQAFALKTTAASAQLILDTYNRLLSTLYGGVLVVYGDSITAGSVASDAAHRWANIVATTRGLILTNKGYSGTVLQNTIQNEVATIGGPADHNGRDDYIARRILRCFPASYIVILYGTNDILLNDAAFSAANYQNDLGELVDALVANGTPANQVVIGSPPYITSYVQAHPFDGGSIVKHQAYVAAAAAAAASRGTRYADVYQYMLDNGGDALISPDGLHPNDAGHAAIATAFLSVIQ